MSNLTNVFLYGTLCDAELFEIVSGIAFEPTQATLPGHRVTWAKDQSFPLIVEDAKSVAEGIVVSVDDTARARLDFYELGFGYTLRDSQIQVGRAESKALVYYPHIATWQQGEPWSLGDWQAEFGALSREASHEYMRLFKSLAPELAAQSFPQIRMRAASRLRARSTDRSGGPSPSMEARDVDIIASTQPYTNYFAVREDDLTFPQFDGTPSPLVRRAAFMGGDAVTVLPYDPSTETVQVVRQFRYGAFVRSDPNPWTLEPVAGRIDPGESPEEAALREMKEETGLAVNDLHKVAAYYPSPAAYSEYLFSYIAVADLSGMDGHVAGLESEAEDIMSHVLPLSDAMNMIGTGVADTGPLVLSLLWLNANKDRLRESD